MSKLLRSELKDIVKECLVEILSEGLSKDSGIRKQVSTNKKINESNSKRKSYLDNITYGNKNNVPSEYGDIPEAKNPRIKTNITQDNILNEMLADTANSTLQEQLSAERRGNRSGPMPTDPLSKMVNKANPEDLFGASAANKWAQLAFFDEK